MVKSNKKGMSHIEIILSFVIFVGFSVFLIAIFNPFKIIKNNDVYLDSIERAIKNNASAEVSFQTLKLETNFGEECFCFPYSFNSIVVKNENYDIVSAKSAEDLGCIKRNNAGEKFFYILSSDEFMENSFDGACLSLKIDENYTLGLFRAYNFISLEKLKKLRRYSVENYADVKRELNIPETKEFSFSVRETESDENLILNITKTPPANTKILARDIPIQLVYSNGEFKYAVLNLLVWG